MGRLDLGPPIGPIRGERGGCPGRGSSAPAPAWRGAAAAGPQLARRKRIRSLRASITPAGTRVVFRPRPRGFRNRPGWGGDHEAGRRGPRPREKAGLVRGDAGSGDHSTRRSSAIARRCDRRSPEVLAQARLGSARRATGREKEGSLPADWRHSVQAVKHRRKSARCFAAGHRGAY